MTCQGYGGKDAADEVRVRKRNLIPERGREIMHIHLSIAYIASDSSVAQYLSRSSIA